LISVNTVLTLGLFYELLDMKINAGTATYAWWKVKVDMTLLSNGMPKDFIRRQRKLWMGLASRLTSFLCEYLLIVEIPDRLFGCCLNPDIISVDGNQLANSPGIVLSVTSKRIIEAELIQPWLDATPLRDRATTRSDRAVIVLSQRAKLSLHDFSHTGVSLTNYDYAEKEVKKASQAIWRVMIQCTHKTADVAKCHQSQRTFFSACSKPIFPAAHFLPPQSWTAVQEFLDTYGILPAMVLQCIAIAAPQLSLLLPYYHQLRNDDEVNNVNQT
jgi:hypothetical protein